MIYRFIEIYFIFNFALIQIIRCLKIKPLIFIFIYSRKSVIYSLKYDNSNRLVNRTLGREQLVELAVAFPRGTISFFLDKKIVKWMKKSFSESWI